MGGILAAGPVPEIIKSFKDQPGPARFNYNRDGKFRIVQFADTHYVSGDKLSETVLKNFEIVLDSEKPDLVIHTGDIIFGKPAEQSIREVFAPLVKRGIQFGVTFGNHDDEFDKTRTELLSIVRSIPGCITSTTEGISGVTNYLLTLGRVGAANPDRVIYLFDSNAYSTIEGIEGYGHIHFDQIAWYREQSSRFTQMNGGKPLPSLAFFHIPLPELKTAAADAGTFLRGTRGEIVCSPEINSGLFVSMKEMGDVQAMFYGHDHDNDYAVYWNKVFMIYGRFSGCDTVYNNLKPSGARVIELTRGDSKFRSWIRLSDGTKILDQLYPDDFIKEE